MITGFQYSFCSYSTTAGRGTNRSGKLFQYSFCSYSTYMYAMKDSTDRSFNTASVLIQRKISELSSRTDLFQYSFCSYSTVHCVSAFYFCSFQYSFCSYSTGKELSLEFLEQRFNTASVLIQLLLLTSAPSISFCFNTASVLIQQGKYCT